MPSVDAAGLAAAAAMDRAIDAARAAGSDRWARYLAPLPDRLRDDPLPALRAAARLARAAFGPKDDVRDALPDEVTRPLMLALDGLLRELAKAEVRRAG